MSSKAHDSIAILIPAAGASRRLGRPKQLEVRHGHTLLRGAVDRALASGLGPVYVVLGAHAAICCAELDESECNIVIAADWADGMGASLRAGVHDIAKNRVKAYFVIGIAQGFRQRTGYLQFVWEKHHARIGAPPQDRLARRVPGKDSAPVGGEESARAEVSARREQAVGLGQRLVERREGGFIR